VAALVPGVPGVELCQGGGGDTLQHLLGEDTQQLPSNVQGLEYRSVLVAALGDKVLLELAKEL